VSLVILALPQDKDFDPPPKTERKIRKNNK